MKLTQTLQLLLLIGAVLFGALVAVVYITYPGDKTYLALLVGDIQDGLKWLLGVGMAITTAVTGGTHYLDYLRQQAGQPSTPPVTPAPPVGPVPPQ